MEKIEELLGEIEEFHLGGINLFGLLGTVLILVVCVAVRRILLKLYDRAMRKSKLDDSVKGFLKAALGVFLWILIVLIVADKLGVPMTSLVAVLSVASLALSLSVQNILTNLFSGMTILGTHPFAAGDWVDIGGTAGSVQSVGLFYTIIKVPDGREVHIPNSTVADSKVENFTAHETRRIDLDISASYDDSTEAVKTALLKAIHMTEGLVLDPAPVLAVKSFDDSAITYMVLVWAETPKFFDAKCALLENIRAAFEEDGVQMTFPHLNVHIDSGK